MLELNENENIKKRFECEILGKIKKKGKLLKFDFNNLFFSFDVQGFLFDVDSFIQNA